MQTTSQRELGPAAGQRTAVFPVIPTGGGGSCQPDRCSEPAVVGAASGCSGDSRGIGVHVRTNLWQEPGGDISQTVGGKGVFRGPLGCTKLS